MEEFSHRQGSPGRGVLPGVATPVPLREPVGLDTNNTLLGRKVLERGRGLAEGDQVLPDGRNAQNCLFRKEFSWWGITWRILVTKRRMQNPINRDGKNLAALTSEVWLENEKTCKPI